MLKIAKYIHEGSDARWHPFRVIVGFIEGYNGEKRHSIEEVKQIVAQWLRYNKDHDHVVLPGMVSERTMLYLRRNDGALIEEPVVVFEGEVNPLLNPKRISALSLRVAILDLAERFAQQLNQARVYVHLQKKMYVLECKEGANPYRAVRQMERQFSPTFRA